MNSLRIDRNGFTLTYNEPGMDLDLSLTQTSSLFIDMLRKSNFRVNICRKAILISFENVTCESIL